MLSAQPRKWYSWDFTLNDAEGRHVADLDLSSWRERGKVVLGGTEYRVRPEGSAARSCQGAEELGRIRHAAWYKRGARVELAEHLSPVLQAFALWLALLFWKRDAGAAGGA
jgi:hypothetical protein